MPPQHLAPTDFGARIRKATALLSERLEAESYLLEGADDVLEGADVAVR